MLAATLTTVVVFFPVTLLDGVSKFLFGALALAVVVSLFASYIVAMTVVPLFCARFMRRAIARRDAAKHGSGDRRRLRRSVQALASTAGFPHRFERLLSCYDVLVRASSTASDGRW